MGFEESGVVDNGGKQSRERPQQEGGEELGYDGVLGSERHEWGISI